MSYLICFRYPNQDKEFRVETTDLEDAQIIWDSLHASRFVPLVPRPEKKEL